MPQHLQQQMQNMSHYSVGGNSNMGGIISKQNMNISLYGGINPGKFFNLMAVKKKTNNGKVGGVNGMLAALHPSGTIHVGGSSNMNAAMMNTDFKMTMKHNSSNQSI